MKAAVIKHVRGLDKMATELTAWLEKAGTIIIKQIVQVSTARNTIYTTIFYEEDSPIKPYGPDDPIEDDPS